MEEKEAKANNNWFKLSKVKLLGLQLLGRFLMCNYRLLTGKRFCLNQPNVQIIRHSNYCNSGVFTQVLLFYFSLFTTFCHLKAKTKGRENISGDLKGCLKYLFE